MKSSNASTPGGVTADGIPGDYESVKTFFSAYDSAAYTGPGSSWQLIAGVGWPTPTVGTYTLHILTSHTESHSSGDISTEYHGWLTINVVP